MIVMRNKLGVPSSQFHWRETLRESFALGAKRLRMASTPLMDEGTPVKFRYPVTGQKTHAFILDTLPNHPYFDYLVFLGTPDEYSEVMANEWEFEDTHLFQFADHKQVSL